MRIVYVLLSPALGMHLYTADLANRMLRSGHSVCVVTTTQLPPDRYAPGVEVRTPVQAADNGFSRNAFRPAEVRRALEAIVELKPELVHFTGPHLWNIFLFGPLRRLGIPTIHTLHDLDPHSGTPYGPVLRLWNRMVLGGVNRILVHGECYRERLKAQGVKADRIACTPLLFLSVGYTALESAEVLSKRVSYRDGALFFGRLEHHKGLDYLMQAWEKVMAEPGLPDFRLTVAGQGDLSRWWPGELPRGVDVRNRLIGDRETLDLFLRCGLVVLPYRSGTQSPLIGAAYFFRKPVLVTQVGALPELVEPDRTGWVVPPADPQALAEALGEALGHPARLARMGEAGRAWYDMQRGTEWETLWRLYAGTALKSSSG